MQKVVRRVELARTQAKRKERIFKELEAKRVDRAAQRMHRAEKTMAIVAARKDRREDWELGPLAPKRREYHGEHRYGTFSINQLNPPTVAKRDRVKELFIKKGDRVCVMEGREGVKGRIGKITRLDVDSQTAVIEGVGPIEVQLPRFVTDSLQEGTIRTEYEAIPIKHLKLVYPLPDPQTGIPRDCILTNLVKRDRYFDVYENKEVWSRVLMPQRIRIPWPEKEEETFVDEDADTLRIDAEDTTFLPTLLRPPMPNGVIDQLRNKNSRYRTRHDEEYVARKVAEDEAEERQKRLSQSMLPRGARNIARGPAARATVGMSVKAVEAEDGSGQVDVESRPRPAPGTFMADQNQKPVLSDELLRKIGAHMAQSGLNGKKTARGSAEKNSATLAVAPAVASIKPPMPPPSPAGTIVEL